MIGVAVGLSLWWTWIKAGLAPVGIILGLLGRVTKYFVGSLDGLEAWDAFSFLARIPVRVVYQGCTHDVSLSSSRWQEIDPCSPSLRYCFFISSKLASVGSSRSA